MKQYKFITKIMRFLLSAMIVIVGALLMVAMFFGAAFQEQDKLHDMAAVVEVQK